MVPTTAGVTQHSNVAGVPHDGVLEVPKRKRGAQKGNKNAKGKHNMTAGRRLGAGGAPTDNINARGHGAPRGNINAHGHNGTNAGAPPGVPHLAAKETQQQIDYDNLIDDFQRKARCADEPFDVPLNEKMQSAALKNTARDLKRAKCIVACAVCGTYQNESDTKLMPTTMDLPPPISWTTHLKTTQNSIIFENSPDPYILRKQYQFPQLEDMHPGWRELLLCKQGLYQVTSAEDTEISEMFYFPRGSYMDMHVSEGITHASLAKACVCNVCQTSLKISTRKPQGCLPQLAIANDLVIGARSLITTRIYIYTLDILPLKHVHCKTNTI
jgi:hypothetical protein